MKERIIISVSTINGSKHFHLGMKAQKRVRYAVVTAVAASLLTIGSIFFLVNEVDFAKEKQEELEKRSYTLNEEVDVLNQLKDELESDLGERESKLSLVSDRLGELENLLGVDVDAQAPIESRLDVAAINSAVRIAILDSLPNGAPVKNARQSSQYGKRKHPVTGKVRLHAGLDFAVNIGTPIYAPADGVVETVRPSNKGSGNFIRLQHSFGITSSYSHLKKFAVRSGNFVDKGELIGYSGNSGLSSGPHLHYEIRFIGRPLNPRPFVDWGMNNFEHIFEKERKNKMGIFNKKGGTTSQHATTTVIAKGCNITGELQLACDIQVDGIIEGKLRLEKTLVVSNSGRLKGEIYADKIIVNGLVEGTCYANAIEILDKGKVTGTIYCDDLSIERGGCFLGSTYPAEKEQVITLEPKDKASAKKMNSEPKAVNE